MATTEDNKEILQVSDNKGKEEPGFKKHEPLSKPLDRRQSRLSLWYSLTALEAIDRLKTTASSRKRSSVVEVMGRDCGYPALAAVILVFTHT